MKGRWFFLLLLIAPFAFALFYWDFTSKILISDAEVTEAPDKAQAPQTIVENTELIQFDNQGNLAHQLRSDKLLSDATGGLVFISDPVVGIEPDEENSWSAQSNQGIYNQQTKSLEMSGAVVLTKIQPEDEPITMSAEALTFFPERNFAETNSPVIIETTGHKIETVGISVDFQASVYRLKSNVKSSHVPL